MSHVFKVLNRMKDGRGLKEGGVGRVRPAPEGRSIVAFGHVRGPDERGDFRAELVGLGVGRWGRRRWWARGSLHCPLKPVRLVTRHWLQV